MAAQSEYDDDRQKQMELVAAMLEKDADCTRILSRDCHVMGVDPRKPILIQLCDDHSSLVEDVKMNAPRIRDWLCNTESSHATHVCHGTADRSRRFYLYDVAAALGNIDVLCTLPAMYDDIVPGDQFPPMGEENQPRVTEDKDGKLMTLVQVNHGSISAAKAELTPQNIDESHHEETKHPQNKSQRNEKLKQSFSRKTKEVGSEERGASFPSFSSELPEIEAQLSSECVMRTDVSQQNVLPEEKFSTSLLTDSEANVYNPDRFRNSENNHATNHVPAENGTAPNPIDKINPVHVSCPQDVSQDEEDVFFDTSDVFFEAKESRACSSHNAKAKETKTTRSSEDEDEEERFTDAVETLGATDDLLDCLKSDDVGENTEKSLNPPLLPEEHFSSDHSSSNDHNQPHCCPEIHSTSTDAESASSNPEIVTKSPAATGEAAKYTNISVNLAYCRHSDKDACSSRREIVVSAVRHYIQHHSDVDELARVLKDQPCSEDVVDVLHVLEESSEIHPGLFNGVLQQFEHLTGTHSGRSPLLSSQLFSAEQALQTNSDVSDALVQSLSRGTESATSEPSSSLTQAETDSSESPVLPATTQTEAEVDETSLLSSLFAVNETAFMPSSMTRTEAEVDETSLLSSLFAVNETALLPSSMTRTDIDVSAMAGEEATQSVSSNQENGPDFHHIMTQCIQRFQQAQGTVLADVKMFPRVNCYPGHFLDEDVSSCLGIDDHEFIRINQSRLCQLMWSPAELCQRDIEDLLPLFDQEITIRICSYTCQRQLFPDITVDVGTDPLVLFEENCKSNAQLFEIIERGQCSCTWDGRYSISFLPACAAAAAGNMEVFRRMCDLFVTHVESMREGDLNCRRLRGDKSAMKTKSGDCNAASRKRRVLRFNSSLATFHSDRLLVQALRHALYVNESREVLRMLDDPRVRRVIPLTDDSKMSLLDLALRLRDDDTFLELLDRFGPDIQGDPDGLTPLLLAVWAGRRDMAHTILTRGAGRGAETKEGRNALQIALKLEDGTESDAMALMLLEQGEGHTDPENPRVPSALELAITHKRYAILDYLVDRGQVTVPEFYRRKTKGKLCVQPTWTPAVSYCTVRGFHFPVAEYLVRKGLDCRTSVTHQPDVYSSDSRTPLQSVVDSELKQALSLLDVLLEKGVDVNEKTMKGFTPLVLAMKASTIKVVWKLIHAGAILDSPCRQQDGESTENGEVEAGSGLAAAGSASSASAGSAGSSSANAENGAGSTLSALQQSLQDEEMKNASLLWHAVRNKHHKLAEVALVGGYRAERETWFVKGEFPANTPSKVVANLGRLAREPRPLLTLSRRRLREILGSRLGVFLRGANLPQAVVDFITMKDLGDMHHKALQEHEI